MLTDILPIQVFNDSRGTENMHTLIENNFTVNYDRLFSLLQKHNGMISGGLALTAYVSDKEELENYKGDCDIWIPVIEANDSIEYKEKFNDMKNYIEILDEFNELLTESGYKQEINVDRDLHVIGKSLKMYGDLENTIRQLKITKKECPYMAFSIQKVIDEVVLIQESNRRDFEIKNAHNNRRLSILFPPKTDKEWEESDVRMEILKELHEENERKLIKEQNLLVKQIDVTEYQKIYEYFNTDVTKFCKNSTVRIEENKDIKFMLRTPCFVTINCTKVSSNMDQKIESKNFYIDKYFHDKIDEPTSIIHVTKGKNVFYISKSGNYRVISHEISDEECKECESYYTENYTKKSLEYKIDYYNSLINVLYDKRRNSNYDELLLINKMLKESEEKLKFFENELSDFQILINEHIYIKRLGFDKIFKVIRFKIEDDDNNVIKEIQVIFTYVSNHKMLQLFDLSFCATGYDGVNFHSMEPELTLRKIGYRVNYRSWDREKLRSIKYIDRGFTIYKTPELTEENLVTKESLDLELTINI